MSKKVIMSISELEEEILTIDMCGGLKERLLIIISNHKKEIPDSSNPDVTNALHHSNLRKIHSALLDESNHYLLKQKLNDFINQPSIVEAN